MADPRSKEQLVNDFDACVWALLELGTPEKEIRERLEEAIEDAA